MAKGNVRESNLGALELAKFNLVSLNLMIEGTVSEKTYTIVRNSKRAWSIGDLAVKTESGTCDLAIQIDGVDVTGMSSVSVSSTEATATATAANSVAAGETVTIVVSNASSAEDLSITLNGELD